MIAVDVCSIRGHSVSCKMQRKSCKSHVFFFLTKTSNAENKATVYLIFTDMPARTHTWSSSLFYSRYITVNLRLKYVWFSGYPTDTPPFPSLLSILKDFPVRQYAQAACDTGALLSFYACALFLNTARTPAWNQLARSPIWAGKDPAGTYGGCDQRRLRRACVFAQSR